MSSKKNGLMQRVGVLVGLLAMASCEIVQPGLGDKVDIVPPIVKHIEPQSNSYVRGEITITGSVEDDRGVQWVRLSYTATNGNTYDVDARVNGTTWTATIQSASGAPTDIATGRQLIQYSTMDTAGKKHSNEFYIYVDNHAPQIFLSTPSDVTLEAYHAELPVRYEAYEDNEIDYIEFSLWQGASQVGTPIRSTVLVGEVVFKDLPSFLVDGETYRIQVEARDKAGNGNRTYWHNNTLGRILQTGKAMPSYVNMGRALMGLSTDNMGNWFTGTWTSSFYGDGSTLPQPLIQFSYTDSLIPGLSFSTPSRATMAENILGPAADLEFVVTKPMDGSTPKALEEPVVTLEPLNPDGSSAGPAVVIDLEPSVDPVGNPLDYNSDHLGNPSYTRVSFLVRNKDSLGNYRIPGQGQYRLMVTAKAVGEAQGTERSVPFTVSQGVPVVTADTGLLGYRSASLVLSGTVETQLAIATMTISLTSYDGQVQDPNTVARYIAADSGQSTMTLVDKAWAMEAPYDFPLGDGLYTFKVSAVSTTNSVGETSFNILYDSGAPVSTISEKQAFLGNGTRTDVVNGDFGFTVLNTDEGSGIKTVEWALVGEAQGEPDATWTEVMTGKTSMNLAFRYATQTLSVNGASAVPVSIPNGQGRKLLVRVRDNAGNQFSTSRIFFVDQSTDVPRITLDNFNATATTASLAGQNRFDNDRKNLTGTLEDDDGIASVQVHVRTKAGVYVTGFPQAASLGGTGKVRTLSIPIDELGQGVFEAWFVVQDSSVAGITTTLPAAWLTFDTQAPSIAESTSGLGTALVYRQTGLAFGGGATDTNAVATVEVSVNGGTYTAVTDTNGDGDAATLFDTWSWTLPNTEGTQALVFRVTDVAGRTATTTREVMVDSTPPTTPTITSSPGSFVSNSLVLEGSTSDAGSGLGSGAVKFRLNGVAGDPATGTLPGTENWFGNLDLTSGATALAEGSHTVYVWAEDRAGNRSAEASQAIEVDRALPVLTVNAAYDGTVYRSADFTISGNASDTHGLTGAPISIIAVGPGGPINLGAYPLSFNAGTGAWGRTIPVAQGEGTYVVTITATDLAGRTSQTTRTVVVDNIGPTLGITNLDENYTIGTASYIIYGSATDGAGSGVDLVEYSTDDGSTWQTAAGTGTWSVSLSGLTETPSDQIRFRARDKAGNTSGVTTRTYKVDTGAPTIGSVQLDGAGLGAGVAWRNADFALSFTLGDTLGLASYTVTRNGAALASHNAVVVTGTSQAITVNETVGGAGLADGSYEYVITVLDGANRPATLTRTVAVDTASPVLTVTAPVDGEGVATNPYTLRGTVTDEGGKGLTALAYSRDSTNGTDGTWTDITQAFSWSVAGLNFSTGGQGAKRLWVRASDGLNPVVTKEVNFYYDTDNPVLSESLVGTDTQQFSNAAVGFSGDASDTNALASLSVRVNSGAAQTITVAGDNSWTWTLPSAIEGDFTLVFTATDVAGRTASLTRRVWIDTTVPDATVSTDLTGWRSNANQGIAGTATDGGSGLAAVEYSLDAGATWNLLTGTTSWTGTVGLVAGTNDLRVRSRDRAGNLSAIQSRTVLVDTAVPEASVDSPTDIVKLNGTQDLSVTLSTFDTANNVISGSGVATVLFRVNSNNFSTGTVAATLATGTIHNGTWTVTLPAASFAALGNGQRTVFARVRDGVGQDTVLSFPVLIDKTPPTLGISSHTNGTTVNKTITLAGTAGDTQGLDPDAPVTVEAWNQAGGAWETLAGTSGSYSWVQVVNTLTYDNSNYDADAGTSGVQLNFRVTARDEAGNTTVQTRTLNLDQHSDRPVVRLSNIDVASLSTLKLSRTIYGNVSDDDGNLSTFEVSLDGVTWTSRPLSSGAWTYDIPGGQGDGELDLHFRATDAQGTVFHSTNGSTLARPRVLVTEAPLAYMEDPVAFRLDTVNPEMGSVLLVDRSAPYTDFSDASALVTNMAFGGSTGQFRLRTLAKDANGIASVQVVVPGHPSSPFTAVSLGPDGTDPTFTVYQSPLIDLSSRPDGSADLQVVVTDNSGLASTATRTVIVDNTAPSWQFLSPVVSSIVNGNVEVKGLASDAGSGLQTVEYRMGYNHATEPWAAVAGSVFNWQINLVNALRSDRFAGLAVTDVNTGTGVVTIPSHGFVNGQMAWVNGTTVPAGLNTATTYYVVNATANTFQLSLSSGGAAVTISSYDNSFGFRVSNAGKDLDNDGIWNVPVMLRVIDKAGNTATTTESSYLLQIDPSGDIPKVVTVYPDPSSTNRTLGGNIRIFGTAEDDDGVQGVYMQVDVDGDGLYTAADIASNGTDWYNGGFGQLVSGTVSWNRTINNNQEFDPPGIGNRTIHFRVRARDINGLDGPWGPSQRIDVDKNVPKIGSTEPLRLTQGAASQTYVADAWLKGQWYITGSIEDESGIDSIVVSGDINGSLAANPAWFTSLGGDNWRFTIPVTTVASSGRVSFTITALDRSTPQLQTSLQLSVQADNQAPVANAYTGSLPVVQSNLSYGLASSLDESGSGFGRVAFYLVRRDRGGNTANDRVYMPMGSDVFTALSGLTLQDGLYYLSRTGATRPDPYTLVDAGLTGNANVRVGGLVRIGGLDRRIVTFNSGTGTLTWADEVDTSITDYQVAYALVVDNMTVETPVYNASNVLVSITNDDLDGMVESVERSGGLYSWTASIDSRNIPDGPVEIHWVSFDKAGNFSTRSVTTSIANNRPLLGAVTLGTDLDGDGTVSAGEKAAAYSALDGNGKRQSVAAVLSSAFRAKGLTTLDIDVLGGNGQLFYSLEENNVDLHGGLQNLRTTGGSAVQAISLTEIQLTALGDGSKTFVVDIWDSTQETVPGTDSLKAELTVPMTVSLVDLVGPKSVVSPFYWNSTTDNSLYLNSKNNGHIELSADLPPGIFNQATGLYDTDPKVSGQVSFRGTAYDDQRITSLWAFIDGFTFTGAAATSNQFDIDANAVLETLGRTYARVATFAAGVWTGTDRWATDGWRFSVTPVSLDQGGHRIEWQLDWDSARVTGVAATDRSLRLIAVDKRGVRSNASPETANPTADLATNNRPSMKVDVVPYVSGLSTTNRTQGGLKDLNIRSSNGRYSIIQGTNGTFITMRGFNLSPSAVRIVNAATVGTQIAPTAGVALANSGATGPWTSLSLSNNSAVSGYLEVFTNGVRALNNVNNNDSRGAYPNLLQPEMLPNREPDLSAAKNPHLTDDRYLRFFNVRDTGVKNGYYPDMVMEGNNPVFSYLNLSGGPNSNAGLAAGTGAGTYRFQNAMPQRARFNGTTGAEETTEYLIKGLVWDQMSMARDAAGRYYHLSTYNYEGAAMTLLYDRYAELYTDGQGWGDGVEYVGYGGDRAQNANNNAISLERTTFGNGLLLGRYQYPKLLALGNSITDHAKVYMMYYDDNTNNRDLIFRNLRVGTNVTGGGTAPLFAGGTSSTGQAYAQRANLADQNTTGRITVASSASRHFDFAVTSDFRVVVVYYDEADGRMKLRYSTNPVDGSAPTAAVAWTNSTLVFPEYIGNYVSMTLDSANGIHIAAYDATDADLAYFYLPAYNSTNLHQAKVDASFAVGMWTKVKVRENGGIITPYIAYFNSSESGQRDSLKLAYAPAGVGVGNVPAGVDANGFATGNWEYMNVPALTPPQGGSLMFKHVNLDFDSAGRPVLGYLGTNLEYGKWVDE